MSDAGSLGYQRSIASSRDSMSDIANDDPNYVASFVQGMRADVQHLYRSDDRSAWTESVPAAPTTDAEAASYSQECALVARRELDPTTQHVMLHSVTVQSPLIRKVLGITFKGLDGINTQLRQLTFKAPFHPFYYRWHRFERLCADEESLEVKEHLELLYSIMKEEITPHIDTVTDLIKNGVAGFDYLWAIFTPGVELYTQWEGQDRVVELTDSRYGANMGGEYFTLEYRYIECDGTDFGFVSGSVDISKFDGVKELVDLDAFPVHLYPEIEQLVDRLRFRGKKFEQLNGFHHVGYSGFYTTRSSRQNRKRHLDHGRIIIDTETFTLYGTPGPGVQPIEAGLHAASVNDKLLDDIPNITSRAAIHKLQKYRAALAKYEEEDRNDASALLNTKQYLLCNPFVRGYCLTFKAWAEFNVDNIRPIQWNKNAFPRLVLPRGYKDIIRAFVQEQLLRDDAFDDIIQGKGLGFIMLLSGEPGVGKTLTAESVAEEMHQPLYMLSASELGESAAEVEESLEQVLYLTNKWNAILLLDECDMFLEARTITDMRRNRLVSVFLRQLEYYRGVMFLTSNRVTDFDAAFESRIHLTIPYPPLDVPSRLHIWKTFVEIGGWTNGLNEADLDALSKIELNGRQIKNIVKTARLLSQQDRTPLSMEHVNLVLKVKQGTTI